MCGIVGITSNLPLEKAREKLLFLKELLKHRGPDDEGTYISPNRKAAFAHTRLAIQDLSVNAHQPMSAQNGRYTIVFNGEIYNFKELRALLILEGESFFSDSDTEVILKLYQRKRSDCLGLLQGMFAFAIWDNLNEDLFLARDRFGIKPLYYSLQGETLVFGSELKVFSKSSILACRLSAVALKDFLLKGSCHEPRTVLENVKMLPAATYLIWKEGVVSEKKYWKMQSSKKKQNNNSVRKVREAVMESVRRHLVSDVPVGVFLSGGIDSTVIAICATELGAKEMRSFSIGFENKKFDESSRAKKTAECLGLQHYEKILTQYESSDLYNEYLEVIDQPTIDGFNIYCVSKYARQNGLKVVLSGLGGDEMFGGYNTFRTVPILFKLYRFLGAGTFLGRWAAALGRSLKDGKFQRGLSGFSKKPEWFKTYLISRGVFSDFEAEKIAEFFFGAEANDSKAEPVDIAAGIQFENDQERIAFYETAVYMRDQLLRDADVMSMACGLELRVPFVDHVLWESVSSISANIRLERKRILVEAFPEIPEWIKNYPKQGFSFPFEDWSFFNPSIELMQRLESEGVYLKAWYQKWAVSQIEALLKRTNCFKRVC